VSSKFLADSNIRNYDIVRSGTSTSADRLQAAGRLRVDHDDSTADRARFAEQLRHSGDVEVATAIAKPPPVYVAVCDGSRLIVAGVIPLAGPFESWEYLGKN
jgi:hypothetical protein